MYVGEQVSGRPYRLPDECHLPPLVGIVSACLRSLSSAVTLSFRDDLVQRF